MTDPLPTKGEDGTIVRLFGKPLADALCKLLIRPLWITGQNVQQTDDSGTLDSRSFDWGAAVMSISDIAMFRQQREATFARPERESYHRQAILYGYGWMPTAVRI